MTYSSRIATAVLILNCLSQCAVQTTPTGGPKDQQPPILLQSSPREKQTNFKGKTIELTFDEKVKLKNPSEEIIITPSPGTTIDFKASKNKITIEPQEPWADNTTYHITFREGIQDVTEGNPADTLHLAFSTGPELDSLSVFGRITNGITEDILQKITVAIYQADTIDIFKHPALYFTKTDKRGRFKLENLKSGRYYIYAFDDRNKNLKVESTTEKFGFKSNPLTLGVTKPDSIFFAIVKADSRPLKINSIRRTEQTTMVTFNKSVVTYITKSETPDTSINFFGDNTSEIIFYNPPISTDSVKINLVAQDSLDLNIDTIFFLKQSAVKTPTEQLKTNFTTPAYVTETGIFSWKGSFNKPIRKINTDSISIKIDSLTIIHFEEKDIQLKNIEKSISIEKRIDKMLFLKEKINPILLLGMGYLISSQNDSSKAEAKSILIQTPEKTANLEIEFKTNEPAFIIQLLTTTGLVLESIKNEKKHTFKNLNPTNYKLRVIVDKNNNGKWDTANIFTRTEPEPVIYYKSREGKSEIPTRANSDIGPLILAF